MGVCGGRGLGVGDGLGLSDVLEQHRDDGGEVRPAWTSRLSGVPAARCGRLLKTAPVLLMHLVSRLPDVRSC